MANRTQHAMLVVEDDPIVRFDLTEILRNAGFSTFEAGTAPEAIAILEKHSEIRAVFTDIEMPGTMDGLALAHYVRYRWPPTIIVISSGQIRPAPEHLPVEANFLSKPYHRDELSRICHGIERRLAS